MYKRGTLDLVLHGVKWMFLTETVNWCMLKVKHSCCLMKSFNPKSSSSQHCHSNHAQFCLMCCDYQFRSVFCFCFFCKYSSASILQGKTLQLFQKSKCVICCPSSLRIICACFGITYACFKQKRKAHRATWHNPAFVSLKSLLIYRWVYQLWVYQKNFCERLTNT